MISQVTIGGIVLVETLDVSEDGNGRLTLTGQESAPPSPVEEVRAAHHNVLGLRGSVVPVVFADKAHLSGFYYVSGASSNLIEFAGRTVTTDFEISLDLIGFGPDVEFETRLPLIARVDTLAGTQVASFWHAPAPSVSGYFTGATVPTALDRVTSDGTVRVFTGLPTSVPPRWTATPEGYLTGSARILLDGIRRTGILTPAHETWEVTNGLVRITPIPGALAVQVWRGVLGWSTPKAYRSVVGGTPVTTDPEFTVLRNDPEEVTARLSYPVSPGRLTVDLDLRRGARFAAGVLKRHSVANLGITRTAAEAATAFTGGLVATAADSEGVRYVLGSAKAPTSTTTATASLTLNTATVLDFFLGGNVAPVTAGDLHTDLLLQYLGTTGDATRVMSR